MSNSILGLKPLQFVHILDLNTNITRLELGPQTVPLKSNEKLITPPLPMVVIKPGHYCVVQDPCSNYVPGEACELKIGQTSVRFTNDSPFPLYPGETLQGAPNFLNLKNDPDISKAIKPLPVILANHAIRLVANNDFEDAFGKHQAGEMWQLEGPLTYRPQPEADIMDIIKPVIIRQGESLRLRAVQEFRDRYGNKHVTGEEWMINRPGAYLPDVYEEVVSVEQCVTLTPINGIVLLASQTLVDSRGIKRLAGEQWLLTGAETDHYFPEIGVEVVSKETIKVLSKGQYCVIKDVVDKHGTPQLGKRELRVGPCSFFLHPGETFENGAVQKVHILGEDDAIVLQAEEAYKDTMFKGKRREPGDVWMLRGPLEYIPPIGVNVIKTRSKIPLSKNEGIYVQDFQTGKVRAEMGPQSYMLSEFEELWEKKLPEVCEELLRQGGGIGTGDIRKMAYFEQSIDPQNLVGRNKTRVVTYRCPGNTAVQVYNYLEKTARVVFGPDLVILGPHENFNVLSLSAGKPKKSNAMKTLCLMLGPDFITDILEVETSDHARLRIQVAFNNHFVYDINGTEEEKCKLFSVPDFIGFACKQMGARIRGAVAQVCFDDFHRHSNQVLTTAVFGTSLGKANSEVRFQENNLVLSSMDIQSIEPVDAKMRDSLSKSVQLAIEISTNSIEAAASHEAARNEQIARGELERQKLFNEKEAERERSKLLELQAVAAAVESTGQAKAEAQAQAERIIIECESEIEAAKLRAEAAEIEHNAQLATQEAMRRQEIDYTKQMNSLEIYKEREMANLEVKKFGEMISTLGTDVLAAIATAGPASQVNLLKSLGLESVLITDGNSPVNLFNTAKGLVSE
uniref:Major vault protein n=1 Tax=Crassostrea virginica TaxID=6565 RepID=A0A8B8AR53_CRAVI|nr:major vault protein-like [Crassostrea virginica]